MRPNTLCPKQGWKQLYLVERVLDWAHLVTFGYSHFNCEECGGFLFAGEYLDVEDWLSGNSLWILGESAECAAYGPNIRV